MAATPCIIVVGAGLTGLSVAIKIAEADVSSGPGFSPATYATQHKGL
jgi:uncharacterized protein with NAD-binding domain and iron-sulfur cluster